MWGRALIGGASLGLYGWRVHDPKGSYAAFFDASDWMTSLLVASDGATGYLKNFVNIVLVDQADGFLLGMAFMALLSVLFWPFRKVGRWGSGRIRRLAARARQDQAADDNYLPDNVRDPKLQRHPGQPAIRL